MAQYKADGIDQKIVAAKILNILKSKKDYAAKFRSDFVADMEAKHTSVAVVRLAPTVTMVDTPTNRDGLLARTAATSGKVEVAFTGDKYFKVAIDDLDVEPEKQAAEIGEAGATAMLSVSNADLLAGAVAGGTAQHLGEDFGPATTGDTVWSALVGLVTPFQEKEYTEDIHLFVAPTAWARLIEGIATLRTAQDPRTVAAQLLGFSSVEVAPVPGALAVAAHTSGLVQARRLVGVQEGQEDFDSIVEGRIKYGTKVLVADAVQVLLDGE